MLFFHFGQSLYRHIDDCGLKQQYISDKNLKSWVKKVIALALVPLNQVKDVYCELLVEKPDYPQLDEWSDYVLETYIEKNDPR